MTRSRREGIPKDTRYQLWLDSGGKCAFCKKKLDRNVLTQEKVFSGEHAHIIADSPAGPRGDAVLSKKLDKDISNIILLCSDCHKLVDRKADLYTIGTLQEIKRKHEAWIDQLYKIDNVRYSLPIVFRHPIKQHHAPIFSSNDILRAILENASYEIFPCDAIIELDYCQNPVRETDPSSWIEMAKRIRDDLNGKMQYLPSNLKFDHKSIFAFGPMPLLMQLGLCIGNKGEATAFQWNRAAENWLFPVGRQYQGQVIYWNEIPDSQNGEISLAVSLSAEVVLSAVSDATPNTPLVHFKVPNPSTSLVESKDDILHFRKQFSALMCEIRNKGYRKINLFPAMPLSLAVELGRQILPKADPSIKVWDFQDSVSFAPILDLNYDI